MVSMDCRTQKDAFCGGKSLNPLREEMFRCHSVSVAGFVLQACSFQHADISPGEWNQQFRQAGIHAKRT